MYRVHGGSCFVATTTTFLILQSPKHPGQPSRGCIYLGFTADVPIATAVALTTGMLLVLITLYRRIWAGQGAGPEFSLGVLECDHKPLGPQAPLRRMAERDAGIGRGWVLMA